MADFTQALISASLNLNPEFLEISSAQVAPRCPIPWVVRKKRLHGGRQEGVDLIEIQAGDFRMRVIPTRGMSILDVCRGDLRLGWDSPAQEITHPMWVDQGSRGGTGWLEGFNEFLVRCGLEWFGPPGHEPFHLAKAEPPAGGLTLHGKIGHLPASEVTLVAETKAPYRLRLTGIVHERMMYGPKFELRNEIIIEPGSDSFVIDDVITNRAGQTQELSLLYHMNFGPPLLEEGARWVAPIKWLAPRDEESARHHKRFDRYAAPTTGCLEQAFLAELHADRKGQTAAVLHNRAKSRAVSIAWPEAQLPHFTVWKAEHDLADGYVTGLEPGTGYPFPRAVERAAGRVPRLKSGQTRRHAITVTIHDQKASVAAALKRVDTIAAGRKAVIESVPPTFG